jgi:hypothetical protein
MRSLALPIVVLAFVAQAVNPSPRALLELARPLTSSEIAIVRSASQQALTAKTFRLVVTPRGQGLEVLMGPGGRPKTIRMAYSLLGGTVSGVGRDGAPLNGAGVTSTQWREEGVTIINCTDNPTRPCDGRLGLGYTPVFEMLQGTSPVTSGERRRIGGRWARAFIAPWTPVVNQHVEPSFVTGDPMPNVAGDPRPAPPREAWQSLWIDTASLLPVRWEVSEGGTVTRHFDFVFEPIDLSAPLYKP